MQKKHTHGQGHDNHEAEISNLMIDVTAIEHKHSKQQALCYVFVKAASEVDSRYKNTTESEHY